MLNIPKDIKMIITDFDGIVTDNNVYIDEKGNMTRRLNFYDVMGFSILKKHKYRVAIISGEKNSAIELIKRKFGIDEVHQDVRNKIDVLKQIINKYKLNHNEYVYIGDDVNDIECLKFSTIRITVPNATSKVKRIRDIQTTTRKGGEGAFREVVDCLTDI